MTTKMKLWVGFNYFMLIGTAGSVLWNAWLFTKDPTWWALSFFALEVFLFSIWLHFVKELREKQTCFQPSCTNWRSSPSGLFCNQHNTGTYFYERWYQDE
jgi:uncharacterized membrane protein